MIEFPSRYIIVSMTTRNSCVMIKYKERLMPCISMFYGIIVYMYNSGKEHNPPHFHVKYNGEFSIFDLEGNLIEGNLPPVRVIIKSCGLPKKA